MIVDSMRMRPGGIFTPRYIVSLSVKNNIAAFAARVAAQGWPQGRSVLAERL